MKKEGQHSLSSFIHRIMMVAMANKFEDPAAGQKVTGVFYGTVPAGPKGDRGDKGDKGD